MPSWVNRRRVGARTIALTAAAALGLTLAVPPLSDAATRKKHYEAWDARGDPTVDEFKRRRGDCNSNSFINSRSDAWRCFVGNTILDPCFEDPVFDREVLCVPSPWARSGTLVRSRLYPDDRFPLSRTRPWALRLATGRGCVSVSGATNVVRGRRLNYICRHFTTGPFLFGVPNRSRPTWTIMLGRIYEPKRFKRVRIRTSWR
jgi:hypothetical protein